LKHEKLKNLSLEVLENEGEIVFLKKIKEGPAGNSYGLHAAKIAGLPLEIVRRATRILNNLKEKEDGYPEIPPAEEGNGQKDLFSPSEIVSQEVRSLNVNEMTPLEALNTIARWQDELIQ
jgi:DNA mismatch repair protein MutS